MRRSVLICVLAATLSLFACSEQPTEAPTAAPPITRGPASLVVCTAAGIQAQIDALFPAGGLRTSAQAQFSSIPKAVDRESGTAARDKTIAIVDFLLTTYYAGQLTGGLSSTTLDQVLDLIRSFYCFARLATPDLPSTSGGSDVVVVLVSPGDPTTTVVTPSEHAAVTIPEGAVPAPTLIAVSLLPDDPPPLRTSLDQYPLFYHFSGTTATGPVTFNLDVTAAVCLRDNIAVPDENLRLAHNVGPLFGDVEILPRPAPETDLGLDCTDLGGSGPIGSRGSWGEGRFAWAKKLLLPAELHAASIALTTGVGGTTKKFSEFGIVDQTSNPGTIGSVDQDGEPTDAQVSEPGLVFVKVTSRNLTSSIQNVPVTFGETTVSTNADGIASFLWDAEPGTSLTATVPNERDEEVGCVGAMPEHLEADPYRPFVCFTPHEVTFTAPASDDPLVLNLESVEKLPGGTQHFLVQSGGAGPYIWSVNDADGGNATFGIITTNDDFSADYTAPASVPEPATFNVCARRATNPANTACASVTITPVPSSGADVIVFNDVNIFDNTAALNPNNIQLYKNLLNFTTTGTRNTVDGVLIHRGHGSLCGPDAVPDAGCVWTTFEATLTGEGSTVVDGDDITTPLTSIGADVKLIILVVPMEPYSTAEVNSLKSFAGQGGRILFVGEHEGFYGSEGIAIENDFLSNMGAVMLNTGGFVDCGRNVLPSTSLRSHQVTAGLSQLAMACASVVEPGPNDYALFYALNGTQVLGAVAKIDLTPLAGLRLATPARIKRSSALQVTGVRGSDVFSWGYSPME